MPLGQMLRSMPSHELTDWLAFYIIEAEDERKAMLESEAKSKLRGRRG